RTASAYGLSSGALPPAPVSPAHASVYDASATSLLSGRSAMLLESSSLVGTNAMSEWSAVSLQCAAASFGCTGWLNEIGMSSEVGSELASMPHTPSTSSGRCTKLNEKPFVRVASSPSSATSYLVDGASG